MDERFRTLQRNYNAEPTGDNLLVLLQEYTRAGQTPEGDIEALGLINKYPDWQLQFNRDKLQRLLELGYPMGVYFRLKITQLESEIFPTLPVVVSAIFQGFVRKSQGMAANLQNPAAVGWVGWTGHHHLDKIDEYDLSGSNSSARQIIDGRPRYQHHIDEVVRQLLAIPAETHNLMERFSSVIANPITKKGKTTATYRIFVPVIEIERAYWAITIAAVGMSRRTRREYAKSMIDWGTKGQVKAVQAALFGDVNEWVQRLDEEKQILQTTPTKLGVNLPLGLSCYWHIRNHSWLV